MFLHHPPHGFRQSYTFLPVQPIPNSHPQKKKVTQKSGPCSSMKLMNKKVFLWLSQYMLTATHIITSFLGRKPQKSIHTGIISTFAGATGPKPLFSYKRIKILFYSLLFKMPSIFLGGWLKTTVIGCFQFHCWARKVGGPVERVDTSINDPLLQDG